MIWAIGLDDTDHPNGDCTTWHAHQLERVLTNQGAIPIERRLVRLWPFAVRRTRGNAALALVLEVSNEIHDDCISAIENWFSDLVDHIHEHDATNHARPGLIVCNDGEMDEGIYWECVRSEFSDVNRIINHESVILQLSSNLGNNGLIGSAAAVSWRPGAASTFEGIAWRNQSMCGSMRNIPHDAIRILESSHKNTFMNRDPTTNRGLISPRTPCPVLFGVRGWNYDDTHNAMIEMISLDWNESISDFHIHRTNQCSDDHLECIIDGTVMNVPERNRGGHVTLDMLTSNGIVSVISFKEGGVVNQEIGDSLPGDRIHALGLFSPDGYLHIERFRRSFSSPGNPKRPDCDCGGHLRSMGKNSDLRCKLCGLKYPSYWIAKKRGTVNWVEPSESSRRHLSMPVKMMN